MRVCVSKTGLYTYPDQVVFCGEPQVLDRQLDTPINPTLIIEVLSPTTEAYDRGRKFEHYRSIPPLAQYRLVSSEQVSVELYTRQAGTQWLLTAASQPDDTIELASIGRLTVAQIYDGVAS